MKVLKLYESNVFPMYYVIKREDGSFARFYISPFRKITESDLEEVPFFRPVGNNGEEAAEYLYRFYGLEKSENI